MSKKELRKLTPYLSIAATNPFILNTSSPRAVMDYSHFSAHVPLINPDKRIIKTGIEYELGKYVDDVVADNNYIVKASIPRYPSLMENSPSTTLIVEYSDDKHIYIDYINVDTYKTNHTFFGYKLYPNKKVMDNISFNSIIPEGTVISRAASRDEHTNEYKFGLNANVVFMSHPSVSEDGYVISESFAKRMKFHSIIKRSIHITKNSIPLNLYGDEFNYKSIPDIGENVLREGLLCAIRNKNDWFVFTDIIDDHLREVDFNFDDLIYVNPDSKVIDIKVYKNYTASKVNINTKIYEQFENYAYLLENYYASIINAYNTIIKEKIAMYKDQYRDYVRITPRLHRLITDAMIYNKYIKEGKCKFTYRKLPIDLYLVEITTISEITPNIGFKLTDIHAAKGVVCKIMKDEDMPVDELGNRADIIVDSVSTISRMNIGRMYEAYIGAVARDNRKRLIDYFTKKYGENFLNFINEVDLKFIREFLSGLYKMINKYMHEYIDNISDHHLYEHFKTIVNDNLYIFYPVENNKNITDVIEEIENSMYKPHIGKIFYRDEFNNLVESKENIRIGNIYIMLLEKIANTYSSVSSSKINVFGFPIKGSNIDKQKYPHSMNPVKSLGETEVRIITSFSSPEMIADLIDINLNTTSHKLLIKSILEYNNGIFNNMFDIDRNIVSYGRTKSLDLFRHIINSAGFDIEYGETDES